MNFLGHLYLNPDDDDILLGNFIADSVKGDPSKLYSERVAKGIKFHRAIDHFTDNHEAVKQGIDRFRNAHGRYSTVIIDVVYDHILASNWQIHHPTDLKVFTEDVYNRLESMTAQFPSRVQRYFPYMRSQEWLFNYQFDWGLIKSLEGLDRRTSVETELYRAADIYQLNSDAFEEEFRVFISDAKKMAKTYFEGESEPI